jgi:hypothetical protein
MQASEGPILEFCRLFKELSHKKTGRLLHLLNSATTRYNLVLANHPSLKYSAVVRDAKTELDNMATRLDDARADLARTANKLQQLLVDKAAFLNSDTTMDFFIDYVIDTIVYADTHNVLFTNLFDLFCKDSYDIVDHLTLTATPTLETKISKEMVALVVQFKKRFLSQRVAGRLRSLVDEESAATLESMEGSTKPARGLLKLHLAASAGHRVSPPVAPVDSQ